MNSKPKKILFLSTYPLKNPRHGGQIRLSNLVAVFKKAGWETYHAAACDEDAYASHQLDNLDFLFPKDSPHRLFKNHQVPFISDLTSGVFAAESPHVAQQLLKKLPQDLDVIHVEQPWLFQFAKKIKTMISGNSKIVYGSQNLENKLKKEIFGIYSLVDNLGIINEIESIEKEAAQEADFVVAVSQQEADALKDWGARQVTLARNGGYPPKPSQEKLKEWRAKLPPAPFAFYVASAHPPNFSAWLELLGPTLGYIPPDSKLVVAGSVCEHIYKILNNSAYASLNLPKLTLLFELNDADLDAVKSLADVFLVPIKTGFGTNLKTAEALISGKTVVSSAKGMRGYEEFQHLPNVTVSDQKTELHAAIRKGLLSAKYKTSFCPERAQSELTKLHWEHCLGALPLLYESIQ